MSNIKFELNKSNSNNLFHKAGLLQIGDIFSGYFSRDLAIPHSTYKIVIDRKYDTEGNNTELKILVFCSNSDPITVTISGGENISDFSEYDYSFNIDMSRSSDLSFKKFNEVKISETFLSREPYVDDPEFVVMMKTGESSYILLDSMEEGEHHIKSGDEKMGLISLPIIATLSRK